MFKNKNKSILLNVAIRPNSKVRLEHEMTCSLTFIVVHTYWKLIIEKSKRLTGIQLLMFYMIIGISACFSKIWARNYNASLELRKT